jgi:hypothetical protein
MTVLWYGAIAVAFLIIGVGGWWGAPRLVSKDLEGDPRRHREIELRRAALGYLVLAAIVLWFVIEAAGH